MVRKDVKYDDICERKCFLVEYKRDAFHSCNAIHQTKECVQKELDTESLKSGRGSIIGKNVWTTRMVQNRQRRQGAVCHVGADPKTSHFCLFKYDRRRPAAYEMSVMIKRWKLRLTKSEHLYKVLCVTFTSKNSLKPV
jgi:hypothetical protein